MGPGGDRSAPPDPRKHRRPGGRRWASLRALPARPVDSTPPISRAVSAATVPIVIATVLGGCSVSAGEGAAGQFTPVKKDTLTVATAFLPSPAFWEGDPQAPTGGFELELARALARRFDLPEVKVVHVAFAALVDGDLGGADIAISQLTPTARRDRNLDFTTPYLDAPPGVLTRPGVRAQDVADLRSLRWVTIASSTLAEVVGDRIRPQVPPVVVDRRSAALDLLATGRADAVLLDLPVALALERSDPERYDVVATLEGREGLAIALPDAPDDRGAIDSAVRALLADGTVDRLSKRWLGRGSAEMTDIPLIRTTDR